MSMQDTTCPKHGSYEFYQGGTVTPPCPTCGYGKYGDSQNLTREEYYHSMGIDLTKDKHEHQIQVAV